MCSFTCILYCNDEWKESDGGALRLYPDSHDLMRPDDAIGTIPFIDIIPKNGRLVIFDSTLVHSVEPVVCGDKTRRALTLWINRPNDSGVQGEKHY
jgi:Rps23 Pro-64 3,4-dihydroxylase Tpa1-like proline 4-hydroxylase